MIILVGGEDDKVVLRSVESYDPSTYIWKPLACLPFAVSKHGLVITGMFQNTTQVLVHVADKISSVNFEIYILKYLNFCQNLLVR